MKKFKSYDDYEEWLERNEYMCDCWEEPSLIDDGWKQSLDMVTNCKSWKTALRRFCNAFSEVNPVVEKWTDCIRKSCENGCFKNEMKYEPGDVLVKKSSYGWKVENLDDGRWYIFLNISGIYAGR